MSAPRTLRAAMGPSTVIAPAHVSDHALLRYLERVKAIDVEAARAEVVAIVGAAAMLGAPCVTHQGHVFALKGLVVTTVLPKDARFKFLPGQRALHPRTSKGPSS